MRNHCHHSLSFIRMLAVMGMIASMTISASLMADVDFHGNSNSKKFHRQACRYYNCPHCTVVFKSRDAAISAGFAPCKVFRP